MTRVLLPLLATVLFTASTLAVGPFTPSASAAPSLTDDVFGDGPVEPAISETPSADEGEGQRAAGEEASGRADGVSGPVDQIQDAFTADTQLFTTFEMEPARDDALAFTPVTAAAGPNVVEDLIGSSLLHGGSTATALAGGVTASLVNGTVTRNGGWIAQAKNPLDGDLNRGMGFIDLTGLSTKATPFEASAGVAARRSNGATVRPVSYGSRYTGGGSWKSSGSSGPAQRARVAAPAPKDSEFTRAFSWMSDGVSNVVGGLRESRILSVVALMFLALGIGFIVLRSRRARGAA